MQSNPQNAKKKKKKKKKNAGVESFKLFQKRKGHLLGSKIIKKYGILT